MSRIVQIVPTSGDWGARYEDKQTGKRQSYPVACWALLESESTEGIYRHVRGMLSCQGFYSLIFPNEEGTGTEEFLGYERLGPR